MKVLWLCTLVLPDFCDEYGFKSYKKKYYYAGWITGLFHQLTQIEELELGFCFPVYNKERMKDGVLNGNRYYSFHLDSYLSDDYNEDTVKRFEEIVNDFAPDIVHIWGSEYPYTCAMIDACEELSMLDKVITDIMALWHIYPNHFYADVPDKYITLKTGKCRTLEEDRTSMEAKGKVEKLHLSKVHNVFGRTQWDRACITQLNPDVKYFHCNRVLRDSFYEYAGQWRLNECERHSIFVSQSYSPLKGLHYLLRAMPAILHKFPDTVVRVAGYRAILDHNDSADMFGPYEIYINDLIDELDINENVIFIGPVDEKEMVTQYLRAHVSVSPSSIENSSNSVCEAAIIGVPVVSSYVGGIASLLKDKESALFYQHNAPYMLAHHVCEIFENESLALVLSQNAVKRMSEVNDKISNRNRVVEVYKEIINGT